MSSFLSRMINPLAVVFACAAVQMATPASAATYVITYSGVLDYSYDNAGLFGAPSTDLTGAIFVAQYFVDTSVPGFAIFDDGTTATIVSGTSLGAVSSITAALTVNGQTISLGQSGNYGYINQTNGYLGGGTVFDQQFSHVIDVYTQGATRRTYGLSTFVYSFLGDIVASSNPLQSLSYAIAPNAFDAGGDFFYEESDIPGTNTFLLTSLSLQPTSLTIAPFTGSAVPEPALWGMMIFGFGLTGAALRKHRSGQNLRLPMSAV